MNLDEAQRKKVAAWVAEGLKLSEIQSRLSLELAIRMTYMDVRLLVDDLKLTPKDVEPVKHVNSTLTAPGPATAGKQPQAAPKAPAQPAAVGAGVTVAVDQLAKPGAVVSGKVTFSDGNTADWQFDQLGRLSLVPQKSGYRPPAADVQQFQVTLEAELSKMGY